MPVTKEQVLEKAKSLSLTLTDAEVEQFVKDDKLPEAKEPKSGTRIEELVEKFSQRTLAEMVLDLRNENARHRTERRELETEKTELQKLVDGFKTTTAKIPEMEAQLKKAQETIDAQRAAEKKRRGVILEKLDAKQREAVDYLLDPEKIDSAKFETTVELIIGTRSPGTTAGKPGEPPAPEDLQAQLVKARKEGRTVDAVALQRQIAEKK